MSNNTNTSGNGKSALRTVIKWAIIADVIWAALIATFNAVVINGVGTASGAGGATTAVGTVLAWVIGFAVGLFQGAIFLIILAVIVFVMALLISYGRSSNKSSGSGS